MGKQEQKARIRAPLARTVNARLAHLPPSVRFYPSPSGLPAASRTRSARARRGAGFGRSSLRLLIICRHAPALLARRRRQGAGSGARALELVVSSSSFQFSGPFGRQIPHQLKRGPERGRSTHRRTRPPRLGRCVGREFDIFRFDFVRFRFSSRDEIPLPPRETLSRRREKNSGREIISRFDGTISSSDLGAG